MAERRTKKEAESEPAAEAEPAAESESESAAEPVFENRAARRARGKGKSQPKVAGRIDPHGNRGPAQSQRSWANRRSGG
jgi:hypothetical protein